MTELFLQTVNLSYRVSFLILAILLLRLLLKKAPKWISVALWGIAAVRLLIPFSPESVLSLVPSGDLVTPEIMLDPMPTIQSGIPAVNDVINPIIQQSFAPAPGASVNPLQLWLPVAAALWLAGFAAMVLYTLISYWNLKRKVSDGVQIRDRIYRSRNAPSPFVLGLIRPRIYLPEGISEKDEVFVIAHEEAHIRRRDHWWKPFGFLLLSLHWFNPLLWLGYIFLCRDIELACDEKVIDALGEEVKADYSQALLNCSVSRRRIAACPLAFGEVGVKQRIKSVLHYKKPAFWILIAAIVISLAAAVCFLTDPIDRQNAGIRDISVRGNGKQSVDVLLDYSNLWGGYSVEMVPFDAQEYGADGMTPYDGALGKYRVMISFGDTNPAESLTDKFRNGQIYELETPEHFGGSLKARIAHPQGHGFVLYIGSDVPFTVEAESKRGLDKLFGQVKIEIEKISVPSPVVTLFDEDTDWSLSIGSQVPGKTDITVQVDRYTADITHADGTITMIFSGMPILNAYFCDLNGDGVSELCAGTWYGSGMADARILVYDFANEKRYELASRGDYDYQLTHENGALVVTVYPYMTKNIAGKGPLVLVKDGDGYRLTYREYSVADNAPLS